MPLHISDYEEIIDGSGGNNITDAIEEAIKIAKEDKVRVRIYIRVKDAGTPTMRKVNEARFDPNVTSVESVKRILVQKLNDTPGPEFNGTIKVEFQDNSNSRYLSGYQRNVRIGTVAQFDAPEDIEDGYDNSSDYFDQVGMDPERRDEIIALLQDQIKAKDRDLLQARQAVDASMGFMFKSQAQMHAMFERATRMLENYTLRFGFPHHNIPGVTEIHGGGNSEPIPVPNPNVPPGGGGNDLGLLPMLIKLAGQFAKNDGPAPHQPPPQAHQHQIPMQGQPNRMDNIMHSGMQMGSIRGTLPQHAQPAEGVTPPPPMPGGEETGLSQQQIDMYSGGGGYDGGGYDDGGYDDGGYDDGGSYDDTPTSSGDPLADFNSMDPDSMKSLLMSWVRASPENKAAALEMGSDLVSEIMND
jgi:hypothetical protein